MTKNFNFVSLTSVSDGGGLQLQLWLELWAVVCVIKDHQPPSLPVLKVRLLKLGRCRPTVRSQLLGVASFRDEDVRALLAAVSLTRPVRASWQRPSVELDLPPPVLVSLASSHSNSRNR